MKTPPLPKKQPLVKGSTQKKLPLEIFPTLLESLKEGVLVVDDQGLVHYRNAQANKLLCIRTKDGAGRHYDEVVWVASIQRFIKKILIDRTTNEEETIIGLEQEERNIKLYGAPIKESESLFLIVITDISELKRLENVRKDFVANVSHELKTPITVVQGFVETLLNGPHSQKDTEKILKSIARQTDRLSHLFDDLLLLSQIEQHNYLLSVKRHHLSIRPLLVQIVQDFQVKAKEKSISLTLNCPPEVSAEINLNLFEQAVGNLIQNALEYSFAGSGVVVAVSCDTSWVFIKVQDKGCGIDTDDQIRIFERFYRVGQGRSRKEGGTGLGLAIVKHIAHLHNGDVCVKSTLGEGSEFTIKLPLSKLYSEE